MAQQCHHSSRHSRGFPSCADVAPDLTFQKPDFAEGAETIALLGLLGRYSSWRSQCGDAVLPQYMSCWALSPPIESAETLDQLGDDTDPAQASVHCRKGYVSFTYRFSLFSSLVRCIAATIYQHAGRTFGVRQSS